MSRSRSNSRRRQAAGRARWGDRPGEAPGQLRADPAAPVPRLHLMAYGPDGCTERADPDLGAVREALGRWPVVWLNVDGLGDEKTVGAIGELFGLHRLALEDVLHVHQRPKVEEYPQNVFVVLRLPDVTDHLDTEQISLFLGPNFVVTFQERPGDAFEPVRERIRLGKGALRGVGPDYLAYTLIDAGVDSAFPVLEQCGERLEDLEDEVVVRPRHGAVAEIHAIKRDLLTLRRAVWPLREMLGVLSREPTPLVSAETRLFLRDCYDHSVQILELVEAYREISSGLLDIYLSSVSARTNEIMKVLTIIATIFIPLGFLTGLYGMNFDTSASPWNMPELRWRWGYPAALALMALVTGGLLLWFRRRGWIGGQAADPRRGGAGGRGGSPAIGAPPDNSSPAAGPGSPRGGQPR